VGVAAALAKMDWVNNNTMGIRLYIMQTRLAQSIEDSLAKVGQVTVGVSQACQTLVGVCTKKVGCT
jgi:hypothetical protein